MYVGSGFRNWNPYYNYDFLVFVTVGFATAQKLFFETTMAGGNWGGGAFGHVCKNLISGKSEGVKRTLLDPEAVWTHDLRIARR